MTDIEKVTKALECCSTGRHCLSGCPYDHDDDDIYKCTSALAKDDVALLKEQQPKWIPVAERLPETDYDYTTVIGYMPHDDQVRPVVYCRKTKDFKCKGVIGREYPTHWMPLPEKPKDGEQE